MHLHNVDDVLVFQPLHSETRNHSDCAPEFWTCSGWRQPPWRITDLRRLRADCVHAKIAELHAGGQLPGFEQKNIEMQTKYVFPTTFFLRVSGKKWFSRPLWSACHSCLQRQTSSGKALGATCHPGNFCIFSSDVWVFDTWTILRFTLHHREKNSWAAVVSSYFYQRSWGFVASLEQTQTVSSNIQKPFVTWCGPSSSLSSREVAMPLMQNSLQAVIAWSRWRGPATLQMSKQVQLASL